MRKKKCFMYYERERNADLYKTIMGVFSERNGMSFNDVFREAVRRPAKRFYVTPEVAAHVVSELMMGNAVRSSDTKRMMYEEIKNRVVSLMKTGKSIKDACAIVVLQQAPAFYLSPNYAKVVFFKIRSGWYTHRKS